jgi:hypothetical protein
MSHFGTMNDSLEEGVPVTEGASQVFHALLGGAGHLAPIGADSSRLNPSAPDLPAWKSTMNLPEFACVGHSRRGRSCWHGGGKCSHHIW